MNGAIMSPNVGLRGVQLFSSFRFETHSVTVSFARVREGLSLLPNSAQLSLRLSLFTFPLLVPLIFMFAFFFYCDSAPERFTALPIAPPSALYVCLFRPFLLSFFFLLSLPMAIEVLQVAHARMQEGHIVSRLLPKLASFRRVRSTLVATPFVERGQERTLLRERRPVIP